MKSYPKTIYVQRTKDEDNKPCLICHNDPGSMGEFVAEYVLKRQGRIESVRTIRVIPAAARKRKEQSK